MDGMEKRIWRHCVHKKSVISVTRTTWNTLNVDMAVISVANAHAGIHGMETRQQRQWIFHVEINGYGKGIESIYTQ
jgi:hypothetical protein